MIYDKNKLFNECLLIVTETEHEVKVISERYRDNMTPVRLREINKLIELSAVRVSEREAILEALVANDTYKSQKKRLEKALNDLFKN